MQCKDIPDKPILEFLANISESEERGTWGTIFCGYDNSVDQAMPAGTPEKLARAKMASLIKRKLVNGCACGCRGDFELTESGEEFLRGDTEVLDGAS